VTVTNAALPTGAFSPGPAAGNNVLLTMLPDFDGDGISDDWETNYFGNVNTTNNASNALDDSDGDGMSNRDEYIAGTNPTNALSVLKIVLTATNANVLHFVAQPNISHSAQWRTNASSALWSDLTSITAQPLVRTVQVNRRIRRPHRKDSIGLPRRTFRNFHLSRFLENQFAVLSGGFDAVARLELAVQ
jgi:hypothetical protein